jgi:hypothetical protein
MDQPSDRATEVVPATLEKEMRLIREAIALVASGRAPRTVVAGLQLSEALLAPAGQMAAEAGVVLVPLWHADDSGADIAIERARQ